MNATATLASAREILPLRTRYRDEMNCQIVYDSIHDRQGWSLSYLLGVNGAAAGFASVAIGGPWKDKPTFFEFYVLPEQRTHVFDLFEAFFDASGARFLEVQTNDSLANIMALTYGRDLGTEKIVFHDKLTTALPPNGAVLRRVTPEDEIRRCLEERQGGSKWILEVDGKEAANGGILFHYNRPYGDVYMEVSKPFRQRGFGSYLVQEVKRACYEFGAIPCARAVAQRMQRRDARCNAPASCPSRTF